MTLGEIEPQIWERLNFNNPPQAFVARRLRNYLNQTHREILTSPGLDKLRDGNLTFATVTSQQAYGLPQAIAKIKAMYDATNMWRYQYLSLDDLRRVDPGLTGNGTPYAWCPLGYRPVQAQPGGTGLWAVSSSASDTTQTVHVSGVRTGGYLTVDQTANVNGITRVAVGSFTDLTEVTSFSVSGVTVGTISLYNAAAAGTELARIAIGRQTAKYLTVQLYPTPNSVITVSCDYIREINDLTIDSDEPLVPSDYHWLLIVGVVRKEYQHSDDSRYAMASAEFMEGMRGLRAWVLNSEDWRPIPGKIPLRRSNLGGYYPPSFW